MYEKQEEYEQKKKQFKLEEDKFREQEADLRGADLDLQNQMIKFSQFLQDNEKKKNEADLKRNEENKVKYS